MRCTAYDRRQWELQLPLVINAITKVWFLLLYQNVVFALNFLIFPWFVVLWGYRWMWQEQRCRWWWGRQLVWLRFVLKRLENLADELGAIWWAMLGGVFCLFDTGFLTLITAVLLLIYLGILLRWCSLDMVLETDFQFIVGQGSSHFRALFSLRLNLGLESLGWWSDREVPLELARFHDLLQNW